MYYWVKLLIEFVLFIVTRRKASLVSSLIVSLFGSRLAWTRDKHAVPTKIQGSKLVKKKDNHFKNTTNLSLKALLDPKLPPFLNSNFFRRFLIFEVNLNWLEEMEWVQRLSKWRTNYNLWDWRCVYQLFLFKQIKRSFEV